MRLTKGSLGESEGWGTRTKLDSLPLACFGAARLPPEFSKSIDVPGTFALGEDLIPNLMTRLLTAEDVGWTV